MSDPFYLRDVAASARRAMDSVCREIVNTRMRVVQLLDPTFDHPEPSPGCIQGNTRWGLDVPIDLDLTAQALLGAAIDEAVPTPVISAALYERFASRGKADFARQVLSAMRHAFGGHLEKPAPGGTP
jgi:hypothetical protein